MLRLAAIVCALMVSYGAMACGVLVFGDFKGELAQAQSVFVFRVESLELGTDSEHEGLEMTYGRIRVVETLKGKRPAFDRLALDTLCSDIRLDVGGYYLSATSQTGSELRVSTMDVSVLDISPEYEEGMPRRLYDSPTVETVEAYLAGAALPSYFPGPQVVDRIHRYRP